MCTSEIFQVRGTCCQRVQNMDCPWLPYTALHLLLRGNTPDVLIQAYFEAGAMFYNEKPVSRGVLSRFNLALRNTPGIHMSGRTEGLYKASSPAQLYSPIYPIGYLTSYLSSRQLQSIVVNLLLPAYLIKCAKTQFKPNIPKVPCLPYPIGDPNS